MIRAGDSVGVAVSGGGDSVALLLLLEALKRRLGIELAILHFHHKMRAEADEDEAFVAALAGRMGLELFRGEEDVRALARRNRWNLEDAARRARYDFFQMIAQRGRLQRVAVAHTLDDQAETVITRLLRGTGLRGLVGIHAVRGLIVRPLLGVRREELRGYCKARGAGWREDASNRDRTKLRARIRHDLIPQIEKDYGPAIPLHLAELARQAASEEAFWTALTDDCFLQLSSRDGPRIRIAVADLLGPLRGQGLAGDATCQLALSRRLILRLAKETCDGGNFLTSKHVEQVLRLAGPGKSGRHLELAHGLRVEREFDRLLFVFGHARERGGEAKAGDYEYRVDLPATGSVSVCIREIGDCYLLKIVDCAEAERETIEAREAIDPSTLRTPLVLRNWRFGDVYCPVGRRRPLKVARMLMRRKIPRRQRASWPVLESGGQVIWAGGFPPAREVAAGAKTRRWLLIAKQDE